MTYVEVPEQGPVKYNTEDEVEYHRTSDDAPDDEVDVVLYTPNPVDYAGFVLHGTYTNTEITDMLDDHGWDAAYFQPRHGLSWKERLFKAPLPYVELFESLVEAGGRWPEAGCWYTYVDVPGSKEPVLDDPAVVIGED